MAVENKTQFNNASVTDFLDAVPSATKRQDSYTLVKIMREVTGKEPEMYGDSIVGFGRIHYKYETGREGDMPMVAFSPRKQSLTLYIISEDEEFEALRGRLGKHTVSKVCLYINKLADVDQAVLRDMIRYSYETMQKAKG
jgi:hypothetical protein